MDQYDIILLASCRTFPEIHDLLPDIPILGDPEFLESVTDRSLPMGILELALPEALAISLLERFKAAGAEGYRFPAAYNTPRIPCEQAREIAIPAIEKLHQERYPTHTLRPLFSFGEGVLCWTFGAASEQLQEEGIIPGVLFAYIDKLDGHVWAWEELEQFEREHGLK